MMNIRVIINTRIDERVWTFSSKCPHLLVFSDFPRASESLEQAG
jgi:hypothetical protein